MNFVYIDRFRALYLVAILLIEVLASHTSVSSQANVQANLPLTVGTTTERQYIGGQKEIFEIECREGLFNRISVEQKGVDIVIRLLDEKQAVVVDFDSDPRVIGDEPVEFVCAFTGKQMLSIEPRQRSAKAGNVIIRFLEQRQTTEKDSALFESRRLLVSATALWRAAKYDEALPLAERSLTIRERELGPDHPDAGLALFTIANIYSDKPDVKQSESFYIRALENRKKALGEDHISLASIYNNLGVLLKDQGQYAKAEINYERALSIRERHLEPNHLLIASALNNLASIFRLRGNEAKAFELYSRVLDIREKALGPDHPDVATALNNVVDPSWDLAKAEPYYKRALAIREAKLAPDHPDIAQTLYNMAILYSAAGENEKAEAACDRALGIFQRSIGSEHPFATYPMNLSGVIAKNKGEFTKAAEIFERTIALKEKVQGPMHPDLGGTLANAAHLYIVTGDIEKAAAAQERADRIFEYNISLNLLSGSEAEKIGYMYTMQSLGDLSISLRLADKTGSRRTTDIAFNSVIQRKGRVLDSVSEAMSTLRSRMNLKDRRLLDDLGVITSKMSKFVLDGPGDGSPDEYRKKLAAMDTERNRLEREISDQSGGQFNTTDSIDIKTLRSAMPKGSALIEFAIHRPVIGTHFEFADSRTIRSEPGTNAKYVAFVLNSSGELNVFDLGDAAAINGAVSAFRKSLNNSRNRDVDLTSRRIAELVWNPIRGALTGIDRLLISPEGELNLLPFEAIRDNDRFLVERYSISYLTTGRDLLRASRRKTPELNLAIVADPAFGEPDNTVPDQTSDSTNRRTNASKRSVTSTLRMADTYFAPLTGAAQEARSLKALFPDSILLTDARASETAVRSIRSPLILHIATHGFFLYNSDVRHSSNGPSQGRAGTVTVSAANPLLRSGLALAGANMRKGTSVDDGILTALEASGLDLLGTKVVVLSACDTGVGEVRNGEGVFGLRRAFTLAGAESVVMSLWPVSDLVTRELMVSYYKNLKAGMGRGESLRKVQLEMIRKPTRSHPFYWASFIQAGEWANLDGVR